MADFKPDYPATPTLLHRSQKPANQLADFGRRRAHRRETACYGLYYLDGEHTNMRADASNRHFGIMMRDANQVAEVRDKLTKKYKIELIPPFGCDFRDPWGNRIQVVDLHDESLVWLLPYREVQKAGVSFRSR